MTATTATTARFALLLVTFALSINPAFAADKSPAPVADKGAKGDANAEPQRWWPEEMVKLEAKQLENDNRRLMNDRAMLENQRYNLGNRWVNVELSAFRRLAADQAKDLRAIRNQAMRLAKQRRLILSVLNGQNSASGQTALAKAMFQSAPSKELTALLGTQLKAISAEDFNAESGSVIATTLNRDGLLSAPPKVLAGSNAAPGVGRDADDFQIQWRVVVDHIRNGYPMLDKDTEQLEAAFTKWETSAKLALEDCPRLERVQAKQYLSRVAALVAKMKLEQSDEVVFWIGGNGFPGGTLGDLMQHITSHRLTLRFGSEAHLALQQVAVQWAGELDKQMAVLDIEMTNVIAANPAHHAALKTIVQQDATSNAASGKALISKTDN